MNTDDILTDEEMDELRRLINTHDIDANLIEKLKQLDGELIKSVCCKILVNAAVVTALPDSVVKDGDLVVASGITYDVLVLSWGDGNIRRVISPWKINSRDANG